MRHIHFILFFFFFLTVSAQEEVMPGGKVLLAEDITGEYIEADSFSLEKPAYDMRVSDDDKTAVIRYRSITKKNKWAKGAWLQLINLTTMKPRWEKAFDNADFEYDISKHGIIVNYGDKMCMMDREMPVKLWEIAMKPVYWSDSLDIVLGYPSFYSSKVCAYRLSTGEKLWEIKVSHDMMWGWNDVIVIDNTNLLVLADDLCFIDLTTGELKKLKAKTGITDTKSIILQGLLSLGAAMAGAALTGGAYVPATYGIGPNVISGLASNILQEDTLYYVSDRENLRCIDRHFNLVWNYELPSKQASSADLFMADSLLYMVNYGFGLRGGGAGQVKCGRPFIASFDPKTGACHTFNRLTTKKDIIISALRVEDEAYLLFDDGMALQQLNDSVVNMSPWDVAQYGRIQMALPDTLFARHDGERVLRPIAFDGLSCPVLSYHSATKKAAVFIVDRELKVVDQFPYEQLYFPHAHYNNYYLVTGQGGDCWVVSQYGLPSSHVNLSRVKGFAACKDYLYMLRQDCLLRVENKSIFR